MRTDFLINVNVAVFSVWNYCKLKKYIFHRDFNQIFLGENLEDKWDIIYDLTARIVTFVTNQT